jgi:hypothetical protein
MTVEFSAANVPRIHAWTSSTLEVRSPGSSIIVRFVVQAPLKPQKRLRVGSS